MWWLCRTHSRADSRAGATDESDLHWIKQAFRLQSYGNDGRHEPQRRHYATVRSGCVLCLVINTDLSCCQMSMTFLHCWLGFHFSCILFCFFLIAVHLVIATPGRVLDLMNKHVLRANNCRMLVLDEVRQYTLYFLPAPFQLSILVLIVTGNTERKCRVGRYVHTHRYLICCCDEIVEHWAMKSVKHCILDSKSSHWWQIYTSVYTSQIFG